MPRPYKSAVKSEIQKEIDIEIGKILKQARASRIVKTFIPDQVDIPRHYTERNVPVTQMQLAKVLNCTFQQIQKYEKGTNGVSSIRLLQLANYLKVPVNYFFEDFSEYLINLERSQEGNMNVNYNLLVKLYSELNNDQKLKFSKSLQSSNTGISKAV